MIMIRVQDGENRHTLPWPFLHIKNDLVFRLFVSSTFSLFMTSFKLSSIHKRARIDIALLDDGYPKLSLSDPYTTERIRAEQ